jgi:type IV pilus assembly protein PilE
MPMPTKSGTIAVKSIRGFTLLELMIVVALIALLAAIALPAYLGYVQRARRADAQNGLNNAAQAEEKFFGRCNRYGSPAEIFGAAAPNCTNPVTVGAPVPSTQGNYNIGLSAVTNLSYTLTATPVVGKPQATDKCGTLSLDNTGLKKTSADPTDAADGDPLRCWH